MPFPDRQPLMPWLTRRAPSCASSSRSPTSAAPLHLLRCPRCRLSRRAAHHHVELSNSPPAPPNRARLPASVRG
ncbi:hypothetical protein PAHAL_7G345600 [Panicum hallii]|uniref:Uncharacterized protein n=1 Tax=Panicum hallii TaxID=206008 RepID=A0A2T8IEG4_9POAL|nr:hypothetical protein PAHAL_7G345600 [Panicum hallii]